SGAQAATSPGTSGGATVEPHTRRADSRTAPGPPGAAGPLGVWAVAVVQLASTVSTVRHPDRLMRGPPPGDSFSGGPAWLPTGPKGRCCHSYSGFGKPEV